MQLEKLQIDYDEIWYGGGTIGHSYYVKLFIFLTNVLVEEEDLILTNA
jgi:hypothetical protein